MNEFMRALEAMLRALGTEVVYTGGYYMTIAGCTYHGYARGRTVYFEGVEYRPPYNIGQAAADVVKALPSKIAERKRREEQIRKKRIAEGYNEVLAGTELSSCIKLCAEKGKFVVQFHHDDEGTAMAAIDILQDSGVCDGAARPATFDDVTAKAAVKRMKSLWAAMSPTQREELLRDMLDDLPVGSDRCSKCYHVTTGGAMKCEECGTSF